jgi:hypothetical protein
MSPPGERVFLAAAIAKHGSADYAAALEEIRRKHPAAEIIQDAGLWTGAKHWRATYREMLRALAITDLYVLTADDGTVGRGVYDEWRYLTEELGATARAALFPGEPRGELAAFELEVLDPDNWRRYAVPVAREAA